MLNKKEMSRYTLIALVFLLAFLQACNNPESIVASPELGQPTDPRITEVGELGSPADWIPHYYDDGFNHLKPNGREDYVLSGTDADGVTIDVSGANESGKPWIVLATQDLDESGDLIPTQHSGADIILLGRPDSLTSREANFAIHQDTPKKGVELVKDKHDVHVVGTKLIIDRLENLPATQQYVLKFFNSVNDINTWFGTDFAEIDYENWLAQYAQENHLDLKP